MKLRKHDEEREKMRKLLEQEERQLKQEAADIVRSFDAALLQTLLKRVKLDEKVLSRELMCVQLARTTDHLQANVAQRKKVAAELDALAAAAAAARSGLAARRAEADAGRSEAEAALAEDRALDKVRSGFAHECVRVRCARARRWLRSVMGCGRSSAVSCTTARALKGLVTAS